ncbi:Uncharacterised protein [Burkholderia pseudomallei]|nr:Uncharacterised protein [Burkholderia pseudomallei]
MRGKAMKREHWACVGAGSGVTGAALYIAHGNAVGALVFGVILLASLLVARSCDVHEVAGRTESAVE